MMTTKSLSTKPETTQEGDFKKALPLVQKTD